MAHGVEGRFPFLDHRVFDLAMALPPERKLDELNDKVALRELAAKLLPEGIATRPKQPYRAPEVEPFFARRRAGVRRRAALRAGAGGVGDLGSGRGSPAWSGAAAPAARPGCARAWRSSACSRPSSSIAPSSASRRRITLPRRPSRGSGSIAWPARGRRGGMTDTDNVKNRAARVRRGELPLPEARARAQHGGRPARARRDRLARLRRAGRGGPVAVRDHGGRRRDHGGELRLDRRDRSLRRAKASRGLSARTIGEDLAAAAAADARRAGGDRRLGGRSPTPSSTRPPRRSRPGWRSWESSAATASRPCCATTSKRLSRSTG